MIVAGSGLGLLVSQLNNFTLAPIAEDRISEAAGVNSAAGNFGLSFGLAMAGGIMLWALALSFTNMTESSTVIPPAQQQQIAETLETDAEVMSNTQLQQQIADEPPDVQDEILSINTDARNLSLQVALLVPAVAGLLGVANSFRMRAPPRHHAFRTARGPRPRLMRAHPSLRGWRTWGPTGRSGCATTSSRASC